MKAGADPYVKSKDGKTPAESAAEEGHTALVQFITAKQAPPAGLVLAPKAPAPPAALAPPPGSDSRGLDFSTGVLIEGILFKKRANRVVRWRQKYYVASSKYNALYFWTGQDRHDIEGVIKKVRFETVMAIKLFPDKHEGRRWDLKVVTGRVMQLLAKTKDEAQKWVQVLQRHLAQPMGAIRFQTIWRMYKAKKRLVRIKAQRERAIFGAGVAGGGGGGGGPGSPAAAASSRSIGSAPSDGAAHEVLMEGELQKKNSSVTASFLTAFRSRYFILDKAQRALLYWNSKPLHAMGHEPSKIPILNFAQCVGVKDASGAPSKRFYLSVTTGRTFELHASEGAEAQQWVTAINSVMPKRHIAATQVQRAARGLLARKQASRLREAKLKEQGDAAAKYGLSLLDAGTHATKIQAWFRMCHARRAYLARIQQKEATARRREEAKKHRLYLKSSKGAGAGAGGEGGEPATPSAGLSKRREKLLRLRALKEGRDPDAAVAEAHAAAASGGPGAVEPPATAGGALSDWIRHEDPTSKRPFWHNKKTSKTTWCDPAAPRWNDWVEMPEPASGKTFYMNEANGKTAWKPPKGWPHGGRGAGKGKGEGEAAALRSEQRARPKPRHIAQKDEDGDVFYADTETGTTKWDKPDGFDEQFPPVGKCARWQEMQDAAGGGKSFYFNAQTAETVWKKPADFDAFETVQIAASGAGGDTAEDELILPAGWEAVADESSGKSYYFNKSTGVTQWKHPAKKKKKKEKKSSKKGKKQKGKHGGAAGTGAGSPTLAVEAKDNPELWQEHVDESSGARYWYNPTIKESTWEEPACIRRARERAVGDEATDEFDPSEVLAFSLWVNEKLGLSAGKLAEDDDEEEDVEEVDGVRWATVPVLPPPESGLVGLAPIDPQEESSRPPLLRRLRNGVVLCKLVNCIRAGSIDERVINFDAVAGKKVMVETAGGGAAGAGAPSSGAGAASGKGKDKGKGKKKKGGWAKLRRSMSAILEAPARDNINLAVGAAQSIGAEIPPHVTVQAVEKGSAEAIMAFLWALIRIDMIQQVSVREKPEAVVLLDGSKGEELEILLEMKPEKLLLRWANFQLASYAAEQGGDEGGGLSSISLSKLDDPSLSDGHLFAFLLRELTDEEGKGYLPEDEEQAAAMEPGDIAGNLLWVAFRLGVPEWFSVESVLEGGNQGHLRLMLLSQLWQWAPNMHAGTEGSSARRGTVSDSQMKEATESLATMIKDEAADVGLGREGRTMNAWINS